LRKRALDLRRALSESEKSDSERAFALAMAYGRMGDAEYGKAHYAAALENYKQALATHEHVAAWPGASADWKVDVAVAHNDVGRALQALGMLSEALEEYNKYCRIINDLLKDDSSNEALQSRVANCYANLSNVFAYLGRRGESLQYSRKAKVIRETLASKSPNDKERQDDLGMATSNLGIDLWATGRIKDASREYEAALVIQQRCAIEGPSPLRQRRVANTIVNCGNMLRFQGRLVEARKTYEQALQIRQQLNLETPDDLNIKSDLSESFVMTGLIADAEGNVGEAQKSYESARKLREELAQRRKDDLDYAVSLGSSVSYLGDVAGKQGRWTEAERYYERAFQLLQASLAAIPQQRFWQAAYCDAQNNLSAMRILRGDLTGALALYESSQPVRRRLAEDIDAAFWQRDLASCLERISVVYVMQGQTDNALRAVEAAVKLREDVLKKDPDNVWWRLNRVFCRRLAGDALYLGGQQTEALMEYSAAVREYESILAASPEILKSDLATVLHSKGELLLRDGKSDEAFKQFLAAAKIRHDLTNLDPENVAWRADASESEDDIARALMSNGKLPEALAPIQSAVATKKAIYDLDKDNAQMKQAYAVSLDTLGCVLSAKSKFVDAVLPLTSSCDLLKELTAQDPTNVVWKKGLARSCFDYGVALKGVRTKDATEEALRRFNESVTLMNELRPLIKGNADALLVAAKREIAELVAVPKER
jgi:tetratricopeptide (TPR) repeat protein